MATDRQGGATRAIDLGIAAALLLATALVYAQVAWQSFVSYDDGSYVVDNFKVRSGLQVGGVAWAFRTHYFGNWHPITWLSYMLDCSLFGVDAGAMHLENAGLHALNTLLVYALLRRLTGARWRSGVVAGLFAIHPLHVEAVAWISERKELLSTFFGLLALLAYAGYARRGGAMRYLASLSLTALGLMSKPMLVSWPFVLLLLDDWPLERLRWEESQAARRAQISHLLLEKLPFFALSIASSVVTVLAQGESGAIIDRLSFRARAANAAIAYVWYLVAAVWPARLVPFYPHRGEQVSGWLALAALALLLVTTACVLGPLRRRRYLTTGWLFYLGTLVPAIGFVQVGSQAVADRYSYVPLLGIFMAGVWGTADLLLRTPWPRALGAGAAIAVLVPLGAVAHRQAARWRDSLTLFAYTVEVSPAAIPQVHYANALQDHGRIDEAIAHYEAALALKPDFEPALISLGNALLRLGRVREAIPRFTAAVAANPSSDLAELGMGNAWLAAGDLDSALAAFRRAIEISPERAEAHNSAGVALARRGDVAAAVPYFEEALRLRPDLADARRNLVAAQRKLAQAPAGRAAPGVSEPR